MKDIEFFDSNWVKIVYEFASTGSSPTYSDYKYQSEEIQKFMTSNIPEKTPLILEFEANLGVATDGVDAKEYGASMVNKDRDVRLSAYNKFFNHPENMERARKIQATFPSPNPDPIILSRLKSLLLPKVEPVHPVDYNPPTTDNLPISIPTMEQSIKCVEKNLRVELVYKWYLGSPWLHILSWWHGWKLERYHIHDMKLTAPDGDEAISEFINATTVIGDVIVNHTQDLPPTTTSLLTSKYPTIFINTNGGYNNVHELTHAVHFSFVPFYKIPRDMLEITPMCMENKMREMYMDPIKAKDLQRQSALAIADMTANTPEHFNDIFAHECSIDPKQVGHVRARMWHLTNMYGKYYSYVLGMGAKNYPALNEAVRSSQRDVIMACTE